MNGMMMPDDLIVGKRVQIGVGQVVNVFVVRYIRSNPFIRQQEDIFGEIRHQSHKKQRPQQQIEGVQDSSSALSSTSRTVG
jgi:hypothetical protein